MRKLVLIFILSIFCLTAFCTSAPEPALSAADVKREQQTVLKTLGKRPDFFTPWRCESVRSVILERVQISADKKTLRLYCNVGLAQIAIRQKLLDKWSDEVRKALGPDYKESKVRFYAYNIPAERFIPNYFRKKEDRDPKRVSTPLTQRPLVRRADRSAYGRGLAGRHIALWGGHGLYYKEEDSAWRWQRPALFCTLEDLNTAEFATQYLAPMLEGAGAVVVMTRERDPQPEEIIIDNDSSTGTARITTRGSWRKVSGGFAVSDTLHSQNPFRKGTVLQANITPDIKPEISYIPGLGKPGKYGVYISWKALPTNLTNARYTVYHAGGEAEFEVNQRIGGSMWVWLGTFDLDSASKVVLTAPGSVSTGTLTADAVKIGGGMGNIKRAGMISGVSRYAEAARYWMQYSGVPDSIYAQETKSPDNKDNKQLDYIDNFKGNGDWCNYIRKQGRIPLDLALGLHTDAGTCDSIVGTLTIHYTNRCRAEYTNGKSKLAGRDLADLVQTQIVSDLRAKYDEKWTRRSMYDKSYAEISRPDMPAILVEMFSHQNANDMAIAMDPAFRFDMARAVYKGTLRFLADRYGRAYTVQPLPPSSLQAVFVTSGDSVRLEWTSTVDPLEKSALPNRYRVYCRKGVDGAFDEGREVRFPQVTLPLSQDGTVYSYKVMAVNEGGESFPSEIISAGRVSQQKGRALVVNGFTRLSPPALKKDREGQVLGFDMKADPGIPYLQDRAAVGAQANFDKLSPFETNEVPGWGASATNLIPDGVAGNTFDYAARHGAALLQNGYSFVSCSRQAFESIPFLPSRYDLVDVIMGAQRSYPDRYSVYGPALIKRLQGVIDGGVRLLVSGCYIGSDKSFSTDASKLLGYTCRGMIKNSAIQQSQELYIVPTFDLLQPIGTTGREIISVPGLPAGVGQDRVFSFGFPIEMLDDNTLNELLNRILHF